MAGAGGTAIRRSVGSRSRVVATLGAAAATLLAGCSAGNGGTSARGGPEQPAAAGSPATPLRLTAVSLPATLRPTSRVQLRFSTPLAASTPLPRWSPQAPGHWRIHGNTAVFSPDGAYPPVGHLQLTIPGGADGMRAADGARLKRTRTRRASTPAPKIRFAQEILARLGYLPLRTSAAAPADAEAERAAVYAAPAGHFSWRWSDVPSSLRSNWAPGKNSAVLTGAVLAFQHQHGLAADGVLGPHTWAALLAADRGGRSNPWPYTYIYAVLDHSPQTLTLWREGHPVLTSPVNGGVASAPTPVGTFPIYERLPSTTMSGTNPDGSHYRDPGVPWVNYFSGGSAVHGFPRASYGSPQSVGCLELPIGTAHTVFDSVNYGTLVTVINVASPPAPVATPAAPASSATPAATHSHGAHHPSSPRPAPTHSTHSTHSAKAKPTPTPSPTRRHRHS